MNSNVEHRNDKQIAIWLILCAVAVFFMIVLGGITRLTDSGLSMVDWKPIMGVIPPLNNADWQAFFLQYQQFPEYKKINNNISLDEFKTIFLFEYTHRILGRLIGLLFFIPFLYFLIKKRIKRQLILKLVALFILGALQGLLGWYMVKSGLVDNPYVSQYRLTAHLGFAVIIYAYILWIVFGLLLPKENISLSKRENRNRQKYNALLITVLLFLMILSGGLVAGTHAGLIYNTFPLMGDSFFPAGLYAAGWLAIFEDVTTIQFNHRIFAYLLMVLIVSFAITSLRHNTTHKQNRAIYILLVLLAIQVTLGVSTLLFHVPIILAVAHQGCAIVLFTSSLYISHNICRGSE